MSRGAIDITGKRYGKLTVLRFDGRRKSNKGFWVCLCDCGKETTIRRDHLVSGILFNCGCERHYQDNGEGRGRNFLLTSYKRRAGENGVDFTLSEEEFFYITSQNCYYCGAYPMRMSPPPYEVKRQNYTVGYIYNGIDRINSDKGYTTDNVRACCKQCNWAKGALTEQEFYTWACNIASHIAQWRVNNE